MSVADRGIEMDNDEWIKLTGMFDNVNKKIDRNTEAIARIEGLRNGAKGAEQEASQSGTLSLRKIGVVVAIIVLIIKVGEIVLTKVL